MNNNYDINNSIIELIGKTPLVKLSNLSPKKCATIAAKVESFNPGGSIKDRVALNMILDAEQKGVLKADSIVVEPTSGNTGIGLAMVCAVKGYKLILVMPASMSKERRKLFKAYGADFVLTPPELGMNGAVKKAIELTKKNENAFMPQQFENPANPEVHEKMTAIEILKQTDGKIDAFVACVGTGGTLTGIGKKLKQEIPDIKIFAVEPALSQVLTGKKPGQHKIQGIGADFVPKILDRDIIDEIIPVEDSSAYEMTRKLALNEGILAGISSGAAAFAAQKVAQKLAPSKLVVTIFPDTGERYLSTEGLFPLE